MKVEVIQDYQGETDINVTMQRSTVNSNSRSSNLPITFSWGEAKEMPVVNWADLMAQLVVICMEEGLSETELPMPHSSVEKPKYRKIGDSLFITSMMNLQGASGYCRKMLNSLGRSKGHLKIKMQDGSVHALP